MSRAYTTFVALFDTHWGFERRAGHKVALHDEAAISVALKFISDFKPDTVILGGDILDCGAISHHDRNKPGEKEGLRIVTDAESCTKSLISPIRSFKPKQVSYLIGNHEAWLDDVEGEIPGLTGLLNVKRLLDLPDSWHVIEQGGHTNLGKLTFVHGDQVSGGEHVAKAAVTNYERSVRFGHFHTFQANTKTTPLSNKLGKTGMAIPCLCTRGPKYGEGKPNKWVQGFNWGYILPGGLFNDYVTIITDGRAVVNGKVYRG